MSREKHINNYIICRVLAVENLGRYGKTCLKGSLLIFSMSGKKINLHVLIYFTIYNVRLPNYYFSKTYLINTSFSFEIRPLYWAVIEASTSFIRFPVKQIVILGEAFRASWFSAPEPPSCCVDWVAEKARPHFRSKQLLNIFIFLFC